MEVAIVLEDKDEDYVQIEDLLHRFNSSLTVHRFYSIEKFSHWFGEFVSEPPGEDYKITCLVSNSRILGARHSSLLKKISTYIKMKGYLKEDKERLPILIVARDVEGFDKRNYQSDLFDNLLFKPIDMAVWHGKIDWALTGKDAMGNEELQKQKPVSPLEMLKDVEIDRLTELGFRSSSPKGLEKGKIAKYYIPSLKPLGNDYGVYATCSSCEKQGDVYICSFSFFGLDAEKARNIRKLIQGHPKEIKLELENSHQVNPTGIVAISEESDLLNRMEGAIEASFQNVDLRLYESFMDFYSEVDAKKATASWLEAYQNKKPLILSYDFSSGVYIGATLKGDKSALEDYLGLTADQLKNFKMLCLTYCRAKQRVSISRYWSKPDKGIQTLIIKDKKRTVFLTIEGSEVKKEENTAPVLEVEVRAATPQEVEEYKREEKNLPNEISVLLLSEKMALSRSKEFWAELREKLNQPVLFVIGKTKLELFDQALERDNYDDYLVDPFDQTYLKKKIKYLVPVIQTQEETPSRDCLPDREIIKVGTQVDIQNFSEISLSVEYYRALDPGCFREFVIYLQRERVYEELLAKHVSSEPDENDKNKVINHFTIFGHGDKTNQRIRQWLNEQYALSVQDQEGE